MDSVGNNVKTDFKLNEVVTLAGLGKKLSAIDSLSFEDKSTQLLSSYTTPTQQSALIPAAGVGEYGDIITFLKQHMSSDPVVQEGAKVSILNGTQTDGLASKQRAVLQNQNLHVVAIDSTAKAYDKTVIYTPAAVNKPATKAKLSKTYPGATFVSQTTENVSGTADFVVILGNDFVAKQSI